MEGPFAEQRCPVITENPVRISNFLLGETDRASLDAVKPLCSESQIGERNSVSVRRVCRGFTRPEAVFAEASQTSAPSACGGHLSGGALVLGGGASQPR